MVGRPALVLCLVLALPACSSTSVNQSGSGGSSTTGGSGGSATGGAAGAAAGGATSGGSGGTSNGGAAGADGGVVNSECAESDGGLLGDDGNFEGSTVGWFSSESTTLSNDAVCGAQSLELSGPGYSQIRHYFTPAAGKYAVSFCAKASTLNLKLLVAYIPPPSGSSQELLMNDTPLPAGQWTHFETSPLDVPASGEYVIVIAADDPSGPQVLLDCVAIQKLP